MGALGLMLLQSVLDLLLPLLLSRGRFWDTDSSDCCCPAAELIDVVVVGVPPKLVEPAELNRFSLIVFFWTGIAGVDAAAGAGVALAASSADDSGTYSSSSISSSSNSASLKLSSGSMISLPAEGESMLAFVGVEASRLITVQRGEFDVREGQHVRIVLPDEFLEQVGNVLALFRHRDRVEPVLQFDRDAVVFDGVLSGWGMGKN